MSGELALLEAPGDGVSTLTLNRPEKLNAFSPELRTEFTAQLRAAIADPRTSVLIVRGAGRAFSAGADIRPGSYASDQVAAEDRVHLLESTIERFLEVWDAPKPVIAQVHGPCMGIANILCACCDIVVAADDATFGWPKLPLGAGMIGPAWAWRVPVNKAKELSYQVGSEVSGIEAARLGFANASHPAVELEQRVRALSVSIARTPSDLLRIKKEAINGVANRAGFRETLMQAPLWDALAHSSRSVDVTRQLILDRGIKGAIAHFRGDDG